MRKEVSCQIKLGNSAIQQTPGQRTADHYNSITHDRVEIAFGTSIRSSDSFLLIAPPFDFETRFN